MRYNITPEGCWEFTGTINAGGYGVIGIQNTKLYAHRLAYAVFVGKLDDRMVIDHLCRNRKCVNPEHLEQVTNAENLSRGEKGGVKPKPACGRGHEFTEANTYMYRNQRKCKTCIYLNQKARRAKK